MSVFVCLYVCLSVCLSARMSQKPHVRTSRNFSVMLPVAVARSSSDDNAICYVVPVLWMTSCLTIIGQAKVMPIGRILQAIHQGAARTGAKPCAYDCLVFSMITALHHVHLYVAFYTVCV